MMNVFRRFGSVCISKWVRALVLLVLPIAAHAQFAYTVENGEATVSDYSGPAGPVVIPSNVGGYPVTTIGWYAFERAYVTSVTIPDSVTHIMEYAFSRCANLTSVSIGNGVEFIGDKTFLHCTSLQSLSIPGSVTHIGESAFYGCDSLIGIQVSESNLACCSLDGVLFNKDKTSLLRFPGGKAGSYQVPDGVLRIADSAFVDCGKVTNVMMPEGVEAIENGAFELCVSLASVTIPNGVTMIGGSAFGRCTSLTSVEIPASVVSIAGGPFSLCDSLTEIVVHEDNPSYSSDDGVLFTKSQTELIQYPGGRPGGYSIPAGVSSIQPYAFWAARLLTEVVIPGSVTELKEGVFDGCQNLVTVVLNTGLLGIGDSAFQNCTSLATIVVPASVTRVESDAFLNCGDLSGVYFVGGAPSQGSSIFRNANGVTVYYLVESSGWGPHSEIDQRLHGYCLNPSVLLSPPLRQTSSKLISLDRVHRR